MFRRHPHVCPLLVVLAAAACARAETLYFVDIFRPDYADGAIRAVDTEEGGAWTLVDTGGGLRSIAVDLAAGRLYWTDVNAPAIRRANLDGSDPVDLVTDGLLWPRGLVLDLAGAKLYWGDQLTEEISRCDLDGSNVEPVRATPLHAGLALDGRHGKLYWSTSIDMFTGDIVRCNLDGSDLETVITDTDKPAAVALDVEGGKVYWTDYVVDVIRRADLDGTNVEELYAVGSNRNPGGLALDLAAGKLYWGQSNEIYEHDSKIMRMDLDGGNPEDVANGFGLVPDLTLGPTRGFARGDVNCDGVVDFNDIDAFVLALTSKRTYEEKYPACRYLLADINGDGVVDFDDIDPFVECIVGGGCG